MLNKYGRVLAVVLILQAILFYAASRGESTPLAAPLSAFPTTLGPWHLAQEGVVEKEEMEVLRADDVLTRVYIDPADEGVSAVASNGAARQRGRALNTEASTEVVANRAVVQSQRCTLADVHPATKNKRKWIWGKIEVGAGDR